MMAPTTVLRSSEVAFLRRAVVHVVGAVLALPAAARAVASVLCVAGVGASAAVQARGGDAVVFPALRRWGTFQIVAERSAAATFRGKQC